MYCDTGWESYRQGLLVHRLCFASLDLHQPELSAHQRPPEDPQPEPDGQKLEKETRHARQGFLQDVHPAHQHLDPGEVKGKAVIVKHRLDVKHIGVLLHQLADADDALV